MRELDEDTQWPAMYVYFWSSISVIPGAQEGGEVKVRITYLKTVRW